MKQNNKKLAKLENLLTDTPEAFYWIGFLLADGSFSKTNRLSFVLADKDSDQLHLFGKFIEFKGSYNIEPGRIAIKIQDKNIVPKIMSKFDINLRKTYNPPASILNYSDELILSLIAGFIDGDGSINYQFNRKDFCLRIKCHSSWINILNEITSIIDPSISCKINSQGYATITVSNTKKLKELKSKILLLNIPILSRKWDIINLNFKSKSEKAKELEEKVFKEFSLGILSKTEIANKHNTSNSNITKLYKKYEATNL